MGVLRAASGWLLLVALAAFAQRPRPPKQASSVETASVLIVVNDAVPPFEGTGRVGASLWVGQSYAAKRGIPAANIVHLSIPNTEGVLNWDSWHINWQRFDEGIRKPLLKALAARKDQPHYIVPVWGVPAHVDGVPGAGGEGWSIDSFLAAIKSGNTSLGLPNPYRAGVEEDKAHFRDWQNPAGWTMYLVTRLDGPTPQIAAGLVDKAIQAEASLKPTDGVTYIDYRHVACCDPYYQADQSMLRAGQLSRARGFRTVLNDQAETKALIKSAPETLWAWGWYSGPAVNDVYQFVEGAVGAQLTSYTATGIRVPAPGAWVELWLRRGITATWGATTEPTVPAYANGDNLLAHFWKGYNFAESSYLASPFLNHTMVFIGDPLYAPAIFRSNK
jgi:uncharacterized protein (TIGR03790 family)